MFSYKLKFVNFIQDKMASFLLIMEHTINAIQGCTVYDFVVSDLPTGKSRG